MGSERPAEPPISAELWARLKRLDARCSIVLHRTVPYWGRQWTHVPKVWHVQLRASDRLAHEHVIVEHPSLKEALEEAVATAEERGWGRPP